MRRRGQSRNYFKRRETSGTCWQTGGEKAEEGRDRDWLLVFWLESKMVPFTEPRVWVKDGLGEQRGRSHHEFLGGVQGC